jgi:hypothetical protein
MKTCSTSLICGAAGVAAWLLLGATTLQAQDQTQDRRPPGNFDPQQMRQRMMDRMREQLEIKEDAEWKIVSERITKVMDARRAAGGSGGPGGFGGPPPMGGTIQRGPGAPQDSQTRPQPPGATGDATGAPPSFAGAGGPRGFSREASPELEALRKAIDSKAPTSELKTKLTALREARKQKEADLEKAQDELRQILSTRQEAIAVSLGLLK